MTHLLWWLGTLAAIAGGTIWVLMRKPCSLCLEGVAHCYGGYGEFLHKHPRTGIIVHCGSLKPYAYTKEIIQDRP
jgi:hypothetical protein